MRKGMPTTYRTFEIMSVCTGGGGGMWDCHHQTVYLYSATFIRISFG